MTGIEPTQEGRYAAQCFFHARTASSRIFAALFVLAAYVSPVRADSLQYIHDSLGRLIEVVDTTTSQATIYTYDAVGNITSINTNSVGTVAIAGFTPNQGPVGMTVTVYGTGFDATPANDAVTFGGVAATVVTATATQLTVTVPSGAVTGPISISDTAGSAVSAANFTVTAFSAAPPVITSFSPAAGTVGAAVTINGGNFPSNTALNKVYFNGQAAPTLSVTGTSISTSVPPNTTSGKISVVTPYGTATSATDFLIPPSGYTQATIQDTEQGIENGAATTLNLPNPNQAGILLFDGIQGQQFVRVYITSTVAGGFDVYDPNGNQLGAHTAIPGFLDIEILPKTGTYTVVVNLGANTGTATAYVTTALMTPVLLNWSTNYLTTGRVTQAARYTFSGVPGMNLAFDLEEVQTPTTVNGYPKIALIDPTGAVAWSMGVTFNSPVTTVYPTAPTMTGPYTLVFDPGPYGGQFEFKPGIGAAITANGTATNLVFGPSTYNEFARVSFPGTLNQAINLSTVLVTTNGFALNGNEGLAYGTTQSQTPISIVASNSGFALDIKQLPATSTYYFTLGPNGALNNGSSGTVAVTLWSAVSGPLPINSSYTLSLPQFGRNAVLTFSGTVGERIDLGVTQDVIRQAAYELIDPNGKVANFTSQSGSPIASPFGRISWGPFTLAGTYTLRVTPNFTLTEGVNSTAPNIMETYLSVFDFTGSAILHPSTPVTGTLSTTATNVNIGSPGQTGRFTSTAAFSKLVLTNIVLGLDPGGGACNMVVTLFQPNGSQISLGQGTVLHGTTSDTITIGSQPAGTYTWVFTPSTVCTTTFTAKIQ